MMIEKIGVLKVQYVKVGFPGPYAFSKVLLRMLSAGGALCLRFE